MSQRYALMAEKHWKEHLPEQYAALTEPETFFALLGQEAAEQVETLTEALATSALAEAESPEETFAQRSSRMVQAQHAAEAQVVREMVLPTPERAPEEPSPEDEDLTSALTEFATLRDDLMVTLSDERAAAMPPEPMPEPTTTP